MRTLKFIVDNQLIEKDPKCDFDGLVPGTEGYLRAEFSFSPEWKDCLKVAAFFSAAGKEYTPQVLQDGKYCIIPVEACEKRDISIRVIGKKGGFRITTNTIVVRQNGGKV